MDGHNQINYTPTVSGDFILLIVKDPTSNDVGTPTIFYLDNIGVTIGEDELVIVEENNFYPFGMVQKGYNDVVSANVNSVAKKFKFNGIEYEEALGFDLYEMTWRNYDASLGRFIQLDPYAEYYGQYDKSPFAFAWNNPVVFKDPTGLCPDCGEAGAEGSTATIGNGSVYVVVNGEWERQIEVLPAVVINTSSNNSTTNIEELQDLGQTALVANVGGNAISGSLGRYTPDLSVDDFKLKSYNPSVGYELLDTQPGKVFESGTDEALKALKLMRMGSKAMSTTANIVGYSTAISNTVNGNYTGAAVEATSASASWKLGSIHWTYGIAWSVGWEIGRELTNTEAYNRRAFGIYSDVYIQRKIANNWGPLTPVQKHLAESRGLY